MPARPKPDLSISRRFEETRPEPATFWIRYSPRDWAGPDLPFLDLARCTLASQRYRGSAAERLDSVGLAGLDDTVYLPPAASGAQEWRGEWFEQLSLLGVPTLIQALPGEDDPILRSIAGGRDVENTTVVYDLGPALLTGEPGRLEAIRTSQLTSSAGAAWPLIPGRTDSEALWREGLDRLRDSPVSWVQPVVPLLSTEDRRRLAEGGSREAFQALFHGSTPDSRAFARVAAASGFGLIGPRPAVGAQGRLERNRALAAHLASVGELWHLAGRSESLSQAFFRAGRWVESETHDIARLAQEGNLGVIDWLEPETRRAIETWEIDADGLIEELMNELASAG